MFDLCWECREWYRTGGIIIHPDDHCHHEPKEKLECWCERHPSFDVFSWDVDSLLRKGKVFCENIKFCPECGKKLKG